MLRMLLWFVKPQDVIVLLLRVIARMETYAEAKAAEEEKHRQEMEVIAAQAAQARVLAQGLKNLVG